MSRRVVRKKNEPIVYVGWNVTVHDHGRPEIDVVPQWQLTPRQAIRLADDIRLAVREAEMMSKEKRG